MIEMETPIFCIALCCDVPIELLSSANSVAILSNTPSNRKSEFPLLATFRCQECANRLDIRFRAKEGTPGTITCFVLPKSNSKTAVAVQHRILPLCLHEPGQRLEQESCSVLQIRGDWTPEEFCLYFGAALPNFPRQWSNQETLFFKNSVSGSTICIARKEEHIEISSQDICTLDILREAVVQQANKRNRELRSELIPDMGGLKEMLERLWREVESTRTLDERAAIGSALLEIQNQVSLSNHGAFQTVAMVPSGRQRRFPGCRTSRDSSRGDNAFRNANGEISAD